MVAYKVDKVDKKIKTISVRISEQLNHYLDIRVMELRSVAENKKGLDKSWLMLRLMELGQDWLAAYHLGQATEFEEALFSEIKKAEKKAKRRKPDADDAGYLKGLQFALQLFEKYEETICGIGDVKE